MTFIVVEKDSSAVSPGVQWHLFLIYWQKLLTCEAEGIREYTEKTLMTGVKKVKERDTLHLPNKPHKKA